MNIPLYNLLQQDHLQRAFPTLFHLPRKLHDPGQHTGHLHRSKFQFLRLVLFFHQGPDVQRLVADQREGPGGIHSHRRQHRVYILFKISVDIRRFLPGQMLMLADHPQSVLFQQRKQAPIISGILEPGQFVDGRVYFFQLLLGRHARNVLLVVSRVHHVLQRCYPHHKKLIQIGCGDTQKFQSFKQGISLVPGLAEHPVVKQDPTQFPVVVIFGVGKVCLCHSSLQFLFALFHAARYMGFFCLITGCTLNTS